MCPGRAARDRASKDVRFALSLRIFHYSSLPAASGAGSSAVAHVRGRSAAALGIQPCPLHSLSILIYFHDPSRGWSKTCSEELP